MGAAAGEGGAGGGASGGGSAGGLVCKESGNWRVRFVRLQAKSSVEVKWEVGGLVCAYRGHLGRMRHFVEQVVGAAVVSVDLMQRRHGEI
jgi:hypothetical protein